MIFVEISPQFNEDNKLMNNLKEIFLSFIKFQSIYPVLSNFRWMDVCTSENNYYFTYTLAPKLKIFHDFAACGGNDFFCDYRSGSFC